MLKPGLLKSFLDYLPFTQTKSPKKASSKSQKKHSKPLPSREILFVRQKAFLLERKAFKRGIRLSVQSNGTARLIASKSASQKELIDFIFKHLSWVESRQQETVV